MRSLASYEKPFRQYPILRVLVPFGIGLLSGSQFSHFFSQEMAFCCFVPVVACVVMLLLNRRNRGFQVALAVAMYCFGFGWMSVSRLRHDGAWPAGLLTARAVVMSPPVMTAHAVRVRVMLADGIRSGCRAELTLHRADSLNECRLRPGDGILFRARVEPPRNSGNPGEFDYAGYLRRQGISGRAYVPPDAWTRLPEARSLRKCLPLWPRLQLLARMQQQQLADRYYRKLPQDEAALLAALSVGYRSAFPKDLRLQFSAVGVSHVLALSGLHLGILVGVFLYVSPRRRSWRVAYYGLVVLMIVAFCLLAGLPASLVRAGGMSVFLLLSRVVNRHSRMLQSLFVVTFVLLLVSPESLFDAGFQLSFLSVWFIGLFMPSLRRRLAPRQRWVKCMVVPLCLSVVAQVGTLPLVLYYFHQIPVYFLLANFLVVPLVTWLIYVAAVFLCVPLTVVQEACVWLLHGLTEMMVGSVRLLASWPGAELTFHPHWLTACGLMVVGYCLMRWWAEGRLSHRVAGWGILAVSLVVGNEMVQMRPSRIRPQVVFYHGWDGSPVHFMASAAETYLLNTVPADSSLLQSLEKTYWKPCHMEKPRVVRTSAWADRNMQVYHGVVRFGGHTWVIEQGREVLKARPAGRRTVACEVLFLTRDCQTELDALARSYCPRLVVLDAGLPEAQRRRYAAGCRRMGWKCYDIAQRGALTLPCQNES